MATQVPLTKDKATGTREISARIPEMFSDMERWMESFLPQGWRQPIHFERPVWGERLPQVDLIDRKDEIVLRAAVPGFSKDELEVAATNNTVTIRGSSKKEDEEKREDGEYYRHEIRTESFMRTIPLPSTVDDSKAKASFKQGLLELVLPKVERAKRHTLPIEDA